VVPPVSGETVPTDATAEAPGTVASTAGEVVLSSWLAAPGSGVAAASTSETVKPVTAASKAAGVDVVTRHPSRLSSGTSSTTRLRRNPSRSMLIPEKRVAPSL
jgi:hypothetical protein